MGVIHLKSAKILLDAGNWEDLSYAMLMLPGHFYLHFGDAGYCLTRIFRKIRQLVLVQGVIECLVDEGEGDDLLPLD